MHLGKWFSSTSEDRQWRNSPIFSWVETSHLAIESHRSVGNLVKIAENPIETIEIWWKLGMFDGVWKFGIESMLMTWGWCEPHCLENHMRSEKARHFWMALFGIPWICFLMWKTHGRLSMDVDHWDQIHSGLMDGTQPHCLFPSGGTKISEVCHVERRWRWHRWEFPVTKNGKHTKNYGKLMISMAMFKFANC